MTKPMVDISPSITRDTSKCVLCRRCVTVCTQIQKVGAIQAQNRGFDTVVSPAMGLLLTPQPAPCAASALWSVPPEP
ncbi:MAG: hypothetical protein ACLTBV_33425 [Enterocloster bolteae]